MTQEQFGVRYIAGVDAFVIYEIKIPQDPNDRRPEIIPAFIASAQDERYLALKDALMKHVGGFGMFSAIRYYNINWDAFDYIVNPDGAEIYKIHGASASSLKAKA